MSASPADLTPGRTPNGGLAPKIRKPKNANPLVQPKKRTPRPPATNGATNHIPNGVRIPGPGQTQSMPQHLGRPPSQFPTPSPAPPVAPENASSGFSSQPSQDFVDYPLMITKRALAESFRHHVLRFSSKRKVDPRNSEEFVRPVRFHRRDPRGIPAGGSVKTEDQIQPGMENMDEKERERLAILKAEKDAIREAEMAQVAPSATTAAPRSSGKNLKKTEQIYRNDQTEAQMKQSKLRYEEAIPWVLEDDEGKNIWVGSYEAALSDTYSMMYLGQDNAFRMIPLEKWYKFNQKAQFKTLTAEEAEVRFNKKIKEPRWFMDSEESQKKRKEEQENKKVASGLFLGKWEKGGGGSGSAAPVVKHESAEADDLDFEEDFADDEDNAKLFEEDEETKATEARIKKDQLQANVFDLKEEKEYEKQEKLESKEKELKKKFGKRTKKALMKREKNYIYDSDTSDNPYTSAEESNSDDTEAERLKEEERKKAEESKLNPEKDKAKPKPSSGTSSKGNNTPSHRPSKHGDALKTSSSTTNLKRPGSPFQSEASGNESTRKKQKKKHPLSTSSQPQPSTANNLQPPSRPNSPPIPPSSAPQPTLGRKPSNVPAKRPRAAGSGSDTEPGAASGGEMSDGARKRQKLRLNMSSKNGTPGGSRSGSPEVTNAAKTAASNGALRAASPGSAHLSLTMRPHGPLQSPANITPPASPTETLPFPTPAELRAMVPAGGIKTHQLLGCFKGRITSTERQGEFLNMVKAHTKFDPGSKLLVLRER